MSHAAPSTATLCMAMNEQQTIRAIFAGGHTVAVVGLSPKAWRESFGVSRAMQAAGWRIIPVNPVVAERGCRWAPATMQPPPEPAPPA